MNTEIAIAVIGAVGAIFAATIAAIIPTLFERLRKTEAQQQQTNLLLSQPNNPQALEAQRNLSKPDPSRVDPFRVGEWAKQHRAKNPYDMGPKNWERCLYDLGNPGGKKHKLIYESDGSLKYQ